MGQSTSFYPQFLTYLQTGKPQYIFNYHVSKGQGIEAVKGEFLKLFQSSKINEIWQNGQTYFNSKGFDTLDDVIDDLIDNGILSETVDFIQ